MALPRPSSPRALVADLKVFIASRGQHRWIAAALALLFPGLIFTGFLLQNRNYRPPPQVVTVQMWKAGRTDAEIIADQRKTQAQKEAAAKEQQRQFQKLADYLGIK